MDVSPSKINPQQKTTVQIVPTQHVPAQTPPPTPLIREALLRGGLERSISRHQEDSSEDFMQSAAPTPVSVIRHSGSNSNLNNSTNPSLLEAKIATALNKAKIS